jgi:Uma2 family endonuclease
MTTPERIRVTAAEFDRFMETAEKRYELINGEIIEMGTPVPACQDVVLNTALVITSIKPRGKVYVAPLEVYLDDENIPQPDVMWIAPDSQCRVTGKRLEGAPDLIVEVLSPSTARHDRDAKFKLYERCGVREYWIASPEKRELDVWQLFEKRYRLQGVFGSGETFQSAVLNEQPVEVRLLFAVS